MDQSDEHPLDVLLGVFGRIFPGMELDEQYIAEVRSEMNVLVPEDHLGGMGDRLNKKF